MPFRAEPTAKPRKPFLEAAWLIALVRAGAVPAALVMVAGDAGVRVVRALRQLDRPVDPDHRSPARSTPWSATSPTAASRWRR